MPVSASSQAALAHLKRLKPLDGWALDIDASTVRLLRRNVPVSETRFLDLHVTADGMVVGILTEPKSNNAQTTAAQAQVLVNEKGALVGGNTIISVPAWSRNAASSSTSTRSSTTSNKNSNKDDDDSTLLTPEQHKQLFQYAGYAVAAAILVKILLSTLSGLLMLLLPAAYLYGVSTCPAEDSFQPKQQLKRVLRGHHLPDSHPDKPKGFVSETLARLQATVATELSTSLGYEVTILSLVGAALVANVRVPSIEREFYWMGVNRNWYYLYSSSSGRPSPTVQTTVRR